MNDFLKRKGIVKVSTNLIEEEPELVQKVLSHMLIVDVEHEYFTNTTAYKGYSKEFDVLPEGEIVPEYKAILNNGDFLKFERVK